MLYLVKKRTSDIAAMHINGWFTRFRWSKDFAPGDLYINRPENDDGDEVEVILEC